MSFDYLTLLKPLHRKPSNGLAIKGGPPLRDKPCHIILLWESAIARASAGLINIK
jgi:hypothetical protein